MNATSLADREHKGWSSNLDANGWHSGLTTSRATESLALRKFPGELQILGQIFVGERTFNVALTQQFLEVPARHLRQRQLLPQRRFNFIGRKAQRGDYVIGYCQYHLRHTRQYPTGPRFLKRGDVSQRFSLPPHDATSTGPHATRQLDY